jgi:hypothetical protein
VPDLGAPFVAQPIDTGAQAQQRSSLQRLSGQLGFGATTVERSRERRGAPQFLFVGRLVRE